MPSRKGGFFQQGQEYTGVPYSSVKSEGRYIGFDINLRTFLAAVQNPLSVLYSENLDAKTPNSAGFYGTVCSSFTSYALQCAIPEVSRRHGPGVGQGVELVQPQTAQAAQVGDVIYTPHASATSGSHIEMVTAVKRDDRGQVVSVRVEESRPPPPKSPGALLPTLPPTSHSKTSSFSASPTSMPGGAATAPNPSSAPTTC